MTCEAIVTVNAANVRVQPSLNTDIVSIPRRGMVLTVTDRTEEPDAAGFFWFRVALPDSNLSGWLRADLIQLQGDCSAFNSLSNSVDRPESPPAEEPDPVPEEGPVVLVGDCMGTITVFMATVRGVPRLSPPILGFLQNNDRFIITEISAADANGFRWYGLRFNGENGWVREDLVNATGDCLDPRTHGSDTPEPPEPVTDPDADDSEPTDPTVQIEPCTALVGLPQVSVRTLATVNSNPLGMATKNQRLEVLNITEPQPDGFTWTNVVFNGREGFIRSDLVTLLGDCTRFTNDARLRRPVSGRITQGFRPSSNPTHDGIDFGTSGQQQLRTPIPAVVERVTRCPNCEDDPPNIFSDDQAVINRVFGDADWGFGYGHHIILRFAFEDLPRDVQSFMQRRGLTEEDHAFVLYAHLSSINVAVGQEIEAGVVFGVTGNTGFSSAHHLHLEVAFGARWGSATKVHPATLFQVIRK
jgi:murein DD-endopeptidase MepM/ murein hydrolase activator NlpD